MGLFGFGKKKTKAKQRGPEPQKIKMPKGDVFELPKGDYDGWIYTYDARPLGTLRKGDKLRLVLVPGDHDLYSIYTEEFGDSKKYENTNCCLTYHGFGVGYLTAQREHIFKIVDKYKKVSVLVEYMGFDNYMGYPKFTALMPDRSWFREELGIHRDPNLIITSVPDSIWISDVKDGCYDLSLRVIPTPKGSAAKPHIEVSLDGTVCAEVTGRQGCHKALAPLVDAEITECRLINTVYLDGGASHRLEIRRKP